MTSSRLGLAVRRHRVLRGLTLFQAARAAGKSKTWLADVENGRHMPVDIETLGPLAHVLGADVIGLQDAARLDREDARAVKLPPVPRCTPRSSEELSRLGEAVAAARFPIEAATGEAAPVTALLAYPDTPRPRVEVHEWTAVDQALCTAELSDAGWAVSVREDVWERAWEGAHRDRYALAMFEGMLRLTDAAKTHITMQDVRVHPPRAYESLTWQAATWAQALMIPFSGYLAFVTSRRPGEVSIGEISRVFQVPQGICRARFERMQPRLVSSALK